MIPFSGNVRVFVACGVTDMRRGMNGLALHVQQALGRDPHCGDLYIFAGRRRDTVKLLWHDGIGMSLYTRRLEAGRFTWPSRVEGTITISASQLAYLLDGIDWSAPKRNAKPFRPRLAG